MSSDDREQHAADLLSAVAHPTRLCLLRRLSDGPCCVSELTDAADALQPKVSRHLGVLRDAGLVDCAVEGRRRRYRVVRPDLVDDLFAFLRTHLDLPDPG